MIGRDEALSQGHNVLAIIPARSGSKGVKDKNIKELNGKPLIAYTIEACRRADVFSDIIVSTDSKNYAEIAEKYGASVPFLRPEHLAADETSANSVILSVLEQMKGSGKVYDSFMLLQPTSPLRNERHIKESLELFNKTEAETIISICRQSQPSYLNVMLKRNKSKEMLFVNKRLKKGLTRRQDNRQEYRINGAIYLTGTSLFLKYKSFFKGNIYPYIMDEVYSVDIDDEYQFRYASFLIKELLAEDKIRNLRQ